MSEGAARHQIIGEITRGYLEGARATPTSWPLRALLGLAGLWFITNLVRLFSVRAITETGVALLASSVYALVTWVGLLLIRRPPRGKARVDRSEALMLALHNSGTAIVASVYLLRLYLDFGEIFMPAPVWVPAAGLAGYFSVGLIALLYAPHSWPSTEVQELQAERRKRAWAPYIIGLPSAGVSIGTALGAVLLHYSMSWEWPLLAGLSLFLACLVVGFSSIGLYRTWLFARSGRPA